MKRVFLLIVILGMCLLVTVGGTMTFLNSNSVLKNDAQYVSEDMQKSLLISMDLRDNKMFLISKGKVIKSYKLESENLKKPSPTGEWKVVSKDTIGGETKWLGINIPWGRYGIHGDKEPFIVGRPGGHACFKLSNKDMEELYSLAIQGTPIKMVGGYSSLIGDGIGIREPGDRGADIYDIQRNLKARGYFDGYINGIYNKELQLSVHEFQRDNGMNVSNYLSFPFYYRIGLFNDILIK